MSCLKPYVASLPSPAELKQAHHSMLLLSTRLPYNFPTTANLIQNVQVDPLEVGKYALTTHAILHRQTLELMQEFLAMKRELGTAKERILYADMSVNQFIDRVLTKRPLAFFMPYDQYLLKTGRDGACGMDREEGFGLIGTDQESNLALQDLLSYDEMCLSALVSVSTPTYFINSGGRGNQGKPADPESFEQSGVYVGVVGTRFERPGQMDYAHCLVTREQNTSANGYGNNSNPLLNLWARFYSGKEGTHFPTYDQVKELKDKSEYLELVTSSIHSVYLNVSVYKQRLRLVLEPFLQDANRRAQEAGKGAYVHVVGIGLGVWAVSNRQAHLMAEVYEELLNVLALPFVSDLDFSYFPPSVTHCGEAKDGEVLEALPVAGCQPNKVLLHFSKRDPSAKLQQERLLVAMYAWDGNSMPGNEYWLGLLSASGDPAAACCSGIPQLQNPDVNRALCGQNALIYFRDSQTPQMFSHVASETSGIT